MATRVDIQPRVHVVSFSYRERQRQASAGDDGTTREVRQDGQAGRSQSVNRFRLVTGEVPGSRSEDASSKADPGEVMQYQ